MEFHGGAETGQKKTNHSDLGGDPALDPDPMF